MIQSLLVQASPPTPQKKPDQENFHTYFFGLIVYLFQSES